MTNYLALSGFVCLPLWVQTLLICDSILFKVNCSVLYHSGFFSYTDNGFTKSFIFLNHTDSQVSHFSNGIILYFSYHDQCHLFVLQDIQLLKLNC